MDLELTTIESNAFDYCSFLKSPTIPRHAQIRRSKPFSFCELLSSLSVETDSELIRIEAKAIAVP
jgi:hypothetical protein